VDVSFGAAVLEASVHDPVTQTINYQYIRAVHDGLRLIPLPMRYAWPNEMDLMARLAGLQLRQRWGGWDRSIFTAASTSHISVYGRPGAAEPRDPIEDTHREGRPSPGQSDQSGSSFPR
jgi:hypothetical protein